jgi:hypothetical protein
MSDQHYKHQRTGFEKVLGNLEPANRTATEETKQLAAKDSLLLVKFEMGTAH